MAYVPRFEVQTKGGRILPQCPVKLRRYLESQEGGKFNLALFPIKRKLSHNQRSYFHGVICLEISLETGYELDEVKEILKYKFLRVEGDLGDYVKSTESLNTTESEEFYEKCRRWALTFLKLIIPLPNEIIMEEKDEL